jgi:hypothetical protein
MYVGMNVMGVEVTIHFIPFLLTTNLGSGRAYEEVVVNLHDLVNQMQLWRKVLDDNKEVVL